MADPIITNLDFVIDSAALLDAASMLYLDLTPTMTGDTNPAPYEALADSEGIGHQAYRVFDNAGNESVNLVPVLSSPTSVAAVVTIYESSHAAWFTPEFAFNGANSYVGWVPNGNPGWIKPAFVEAKTVKSYSIGASSGALDWIKRAPQSWTLHGSNDSGGSSDSGSWDLLDSRSAETGWGPGEVRYYQIANTTAYKQYKLTVISNNGGSGGYISVAHFGLYDEATSPYTRWETSGYATSGWIGLDFGTKQRVTAYQIQATDFTDGAPRTWQLQGSNNFYDWSTVHDQSVAETFQPDTGSLSITKTYSVPYSGDYRFYRLNILTVKNDLAQPIDEYVFQTPVTIQELKFFSDTSRTFDHVTTSVSYFSAGYTPLLYAFNADLTATSGLNAIFQVPVVDFSTTMHAQLSAAINLPVPIFDLSVSAGADFTCSYSQPDETIFAAISGLSASYLHGGICDFTTVVSGDLSAGYSSSPEFHAVLTGVAELSGTCTSGRLFNLSITALSELSAVCIRGIHLDTTLAASAVFQGDYAVVPAFTLTTTVDSELLTFFTAVQPALLSSVWAVNLSSGAHSQYDNYNFNSFTRHKGQYYAASSTGLYRLTGDSDAGVPIPAYVETGDVEPADSMSYLMDLFIDGRSNNVLNVRVTTDQIKEREYVTVMGSMENNATIRRCKTAHGIKGRKWRVRISNENGALMELLKLEPKFVASQRHA